MRTERKNLTDVDTGTAECIVSDLKAQKPKITNVMIGFLLENSLHFTYFS